LDNHGNPPEAGKPPPEAKPERVIYTRFVYDDDMEDIAAILGPSPSPEPQAVPAVVKKGGRKKKGTS
jgi:hypothetical protein